MSILAAGAGYLGRAILEKLQLDGQRTIAWVITAASAQRLKSEGIEAMPCDITDLRSVEYARKQLAEQTRAVICCVTTPRGGGEAAYRATYLEGVRNLTNAFDCVPVVFVSSTSVYGQTDGEVVDETSPTSPLAATSKILLEAEAIVLHAKGIVVRLAGLYGENRSVLLQKFLNGTARIESGGGRVLNQIHRDDAAMAIAMLTQRAASVSGIFNVADDSPMTQSEFYKRLADLLGRPMPPEGPRDPNKRRGWTSKRVSNQKMRQLGWRPSVPSWFDAFARGDFRDMMDGSKLAG